MRPRFRPVVLLLPVLVMACGDAPSAPPNLSANVPPPPVSRFDGVYTGLATRNFGPPGQCGPNIMMQLVVAQGRASGTLPRQGEARGLVTPGGSLTLRSTLDAAERTTGQITAAGFVARYQTLVCAWDIRLHKTG